MTRLSAEQGRVLGALVEKERTTPALYPLTDAALLAACNQATSREPVVQYDIATLRPAVRELRERGLLRTVHRSGERSDKHRHELPAGLGLSDEQSAVLALLLLRGPQTAAELRARAERLQAFATVEQVEAVLSELASREEPLAVLLGRHPGRSAQRWDQLLAEPISRQDVTTGPEPTTDVPDQEVVMTGIGVPTTSLGPARPVDVSLEAAAPATDLAAILRRVDHLDAEVDALRTRLDQLES